MAPEDIAFDATPNAARAVHLRRSLERTLQDSLARNIDAVSRVFPTASAAARGGLLRLDNHLIHGGHGDSRLFTLHWMLASGTAAQHKDRVGAALGLIADWQPASRRQGLDVDTLVWDEVDAELMHFLASPEGPRTREGHTPEIVRLDATSLRNGRAWVDEALPLLRDLDPELHGELEALVGGLRLFAGRGARGVTSTRCFGTILLRVPDSAVEKADPLVYFLDHITHETSHLCLHGLMNIDRLITNDHTERFDAPMRRDPRPLYGIYHAVFVLARIVRILRRYETHKPAVEQLRIEYTGKFQKGLATVRAHGALTDAGATLLDSCEQMVADEVGLVPA